MARALLEPFHQEVRSCEVNGGSGDCDHAACRELTVVTIPDGDDQEDAVFALTWRHRLRWLHSNRHPVCSLRHGHDGCDRLSCAEVVTTAARRLRERGDFCGRYSPALFRQKAVNTFKDVWFELSASCSCPDEVRRSGRRHPDDCQRPYVRIDRLATEREPKWFARALPDSTDRLIVRSLAWDLRSNSQRGGRLDYLAAAFPDDKLSRIDAANRVQRAVCRLGARAEDPDLSPSERRTIENFLRFNIDGPLDERDAGTPVEWDHDTGQPIVSGSHRSGFTEADPAKDGGSDGPPSVPGRQRSHPPLPDTDPGWETGDGWSEAVAACCQLLRHCRHEDIQRIIDEDDALSDQQARLLTAVIEAQTAEGAKACEAAVIELFEIVSHVRASSPDPEITGLLDEFVDAVIASGQWNHES